MSYFDRAAQQWTNARDTEAGYVREEIQRVETVIAELNVELQDASKPDNAEALQRDLDERIDRRNKQQALINDIQTEITDLENAIAPDSDFTRLEAELKTIRDPYMALYDQLQAERMKDVDDQDATLIAQLISQLNADHPAVVAKQAELDAITNTKNRNNGILAGKRRHIASERIVLSSYEREVTKFQNRLAQPSERKPSIEAAIAERQGYITELNGRIDAINTKYAKYAANIAVGRLYYLNGVRKASDAANADVFSDATEGGATIQQIEDAYYDSEDLLDNPIMEMSINGWPPSRARNFSERRASRRAQQLVRKVGAFLAGAPHWTNTQRENQLSRLNVYSQYVATAGITEMILTRETNTAKERVDALIQAQIDAAESPVAESA